jgi:hypothetical protein
MQRIAAPGVSDQQEAVPTSDQPPPRGARVRRQAQPTSAARPQVEASEGRPEAPRPDGRLCGGYMMGSGIGGGFMLGSGN